VHMSARMALEVCQRLTGSPQKLDTLL
jgi:hypothetical protein